MPTSPTASPIVKLRISAAERDELARLADQAGVSLSQAFRRGARMYLEALSLPRSRREARLSAGRRRAA
jgi:hypothetical protein